MKLKKAILMILTILPLAVIAVALIFLPDRIPVHYGTDLTVDRYGSKYELLILPGVILVMGLVFLLADRLHMKDANRKLMLDIELAFLLFFNALDYFLLYIQATETSDLNAVGFERFIMLGFGVFFIYLGNLMPMSRRNSLVGLRTVWSRKSDTVWKKSQLFGGASMMLLGAVDILLAFLFPNIFLFVGLLIAVAVIDTVYTYIAAKKDPHPDDAEEA